MKDKSMTVLVRTANINDACYRVTKSGEEATIWLCRYNGLWRAVKTMPLFDFEEWAVSMNLLGAVDGGYALLSDLVAQVPEKVDTE